MEQNNFNPWVAPVQPFPPLKPEEFYTESLTVGEIELDENEDLSKEDFLKLFSEARCNAFRPDPCGPVIIMLEKTTIKNENYSKELEKYNKKLVIYESDFKVYKEKLAKWLEASKQYKTDAESLKIEEEKRTLKVLLAKYGDPNAETK